MPWTEEWKERQRPANRELETGWLALIDGLVEAAGLEEDQPGALGGSVDFGKAGRIEVWAGGAFIDFVLNEQEATIELYTQNGPHPAQYRGQVPIHGCKCNLKEFGIDEWVSAVNVGSALVNQLNKALEK